MRRMQRLVRPSHGRGLGIQQRPNFLQHGLVRELSARASAHYRLAARLTFPADRTALRPSIPTIAVWIRLSLQATYDHARTTPVNSDEGHSSLSETEMVVRLFS